MDDKLQKTIEYIRRAKAGDKAALNEVCRRYLARVHEIAHIRLGQLRGRTDSMDIVQSALVEAVGDLDRFDTESEPRFINWLAKIVENKIRDRIDYYGAQKRDVGREARPDAEDGPPISQLGKVEHGDITSPAAMKMVAELERLTLLEEGMNQLDEKDREIIVCRNHCGMTFPEIAREIGIAEDAARMRYKRAVVKLTGLLAGKMEP